MPRYRKNFITDAIIRIDFENIISELNGPLSEDLEIEIMKFFTLKESREAFNETIIINQSTGKIDRNRVVFKEWNYWGNEKLKRFSITQNHLLIAYNKYLNYEDFTAPFLSILSKLSSQFPDLRAKRLGMRYVNNIRFDEPAILAWDKYINSALLCIFSVPDDTKEITRAFQVLELYFAEEDLRLKLQYGMHNPDYPSPIKQKLFVLDLDAYRSSTFTVEEVRDVIPICHSRIEALFEKSITQSLREKLNE